MNECKNFKYRCDTCTHMCAERLGDVECCNLCGESFDGENYIDCYEAIEESEGK